MLKFKNIEVPDIFYLYGILEEISHNALNTLDTESEFIRTWITAHHTSMYEHNFPSFLLSMVRFSPEKNISKEELKKILSYSLALGIETIVYTEFLSDYMEAHSLNSSTEIDIYISLCKKLIPSFENTVNTFNSILSNYIDKIYLDLIGKLKFKKLYVDIK